VSCSIKYSKGVFIHGEGVKVVHHLNNKIVHQKVVELCHQSTWHVSFVWTTYSFALYISHSASYLTCVQLADAQLAHTQTWI